VALTGIEPEPLQLIDYFLNKLRYSVPHYYERKVKNVSNFSCHRAILFIVKDSAQALIGCLLGIRARQTLASEESGR
jgi:hypothetical protein